MKITIVTPCLNAEETIERSIVSVISQKKDVEYIVMDGGSTDGTVNIVNKFSNSIATLISEKDSGHYSAVLRGFSMSSGEIMGWLGSDDILLPGALSAVLAVFESFPQIEWLTTLSPVLSTGGRLTHTVVPGFSRDALLDGVYGPIHRPRCVSAIQQESTFWRRSLWERAGATLDLDYHLAADFELWARFSRFAKLYCTDVMIGAFGVRSDQISRRHHEDYDNQCEAILARERSNSGWVQKETDPSGMRPYMGDYAIFHSETVVKVYIQPFFIVDAAKSDFKLMIRRRVIA